MFGDSADEELLRQAGLDTASAVIITFADPAVSVGIVRSVRRLRADVPVLVRTQDDVGLAELTAAGATEVVPETFEASLMLVSQVLMLLQACRCPGWCAPSRISAPAATRRCATCSATRARQVDRRNATPSARSCAPSCCRPAPGRSAGGSTRCAPAAPRWPSRPCAAMASPAASPTAATELREGDIVVDLRHAGGAGACRGGAAGGLSGRGYNARPAIRAADDRAMNRDDHHFPPHHSPLREDIHALGEHVGEVLREQGGR